MSGTELKRITDEGGAIELAELLNGNRRSRPIVVITVPAGRGEPFIDVDTVLDEVGNLAHVYVMDTGPFSWTFSSMMPGLTQVYGGAGRVYPVGHRWVSDPSASPLRFAYNEEEGGRATRSLVSDALGMAAAAGLIQLSPSRHRVRVQGQVVGIPVPERALVKADGRLAPIAQELTVPRVPMTRVVSVGMQVAGWYDTETRRLDITDSLLAAEDALARYAAGDLVLTLVDDVHADQAVLLLHPDVPVSLSRAQVTSNELDDLRTLMTPGEVLAARLTSTGPNWNLTLLDVDDDEAPVPAASLLAGGPPWLEPPPEEVAAEWADDVPLVLGRLPDEVGPTPPVDEPVPAAVPQTVTTPSARPTPLFLDKKRDLGRPGAPKPTAATASMALTIDGLRAQVASLERTVEAANAELRAGNAERAALISIRHDQEHRLARLEHELQVQRARLRKAKRPGPHVERATPVFADPEQGFRYAVLTAWAVRTPAGEQSARPLPDFDIGPQFLPSLETTPGVSLEKVADVVVEIVTGRAHEVAGRDLHQLRESATPNAPYLRRAGDDATCWRAALQINTPQARRIHYWVPPSGRVELSRVALHDDFRP